MNRMAMKLKALVGKQVWGGNAFGLSGTSYCMSAEMM